MQRILGIDFGERRFGIALSDPFGWTAQPLETIVVKTRPQVFEELYRLIETHEVEIVVWGLPLGLNGQEGPQALKVKEFVRHFEAFLRKKERSGAVKMDFFDERLSTQGAERVLLEADLSRQKRKQVIDKQAAAFMLQGYLQLHASTLS